MSRETVKCDRIFADLAQRLTQRRRDRPLRVAVDGRTAAGKSSFANILAEAIELAGGSALRASIDDFHQPSIVRRRKGRFSPDGYYEDARDVASFRALLLDPLGPGGNWRCATESFDLERDQLVELVFQEVSPNTILIADGTFLQRPELADAWDVIIYLDVPAAIATARGINRDERSLGGLRSARALYERRYAPAFDRYEASCCPAEGAHIVIDYRDPIRPEVLHFGLSA